MVVFVVVKATCASSCPLCHTAFSPRQLVRGLPEPGAALRYLGVRGCDSITSSSITCVARACRGLEELDGGRVDLLTSPVMSSLAAHCRGITTMSVPVPRAFAYPVQRMQCLLCVRLSSL